MKSEIANVAANVGALDSNVNKMPIYGTQVMVQSEDEKQMRKQVRKEEKRMQKLVSKAGQDADSDEDDFDPREMLAKRQVALATAMSKPVIR